MTDEEEDNFDFNRKSITHSTSTSHFLIMISRSQSLFLLLVILTLIFIISLSPVNAQPTGLLRRRTASNTLPPTSVQLKQVTRSKLVERAKRKATRTAKRQAAPSCGASENLQRFTDALGGIAAPPVYGCSGSWMTNGQRYNFEIEALDASCYAQMQACQLAANQGGNKGDMTVSACEGQQVQACLRLASETAS
ncbi:hypothetical protein I302_105511 [Kwoniella bestiolae CBS 10118]|uniref:Uncharacterized protein n=1 Tax=Kwoniella bestiolae CBS 10118 TaxID=1296100 RepID=A0A1B9FTC0_9TREE|nr:hypothetical protein I302_08792 [Kwoniella bestiolae CBS 10118]OCF22011.1 hypothetical protein I302_08792 [Kwoniella bestiolae CBS 10118]